MYAHSSKVGYEEYHPATQAGRILDLLTMATGIGFLCVLTGYLATTFLSRGRGEGKEGDDMADIKAELDRIN